MNILICGFMGAGKTTFCEKLVLLDGWTYIDLDKFIESDESMTIAEIFSVKGESYFRDCEINSLKTLIKQDKLLISLGGGALSNEFFAILNDSDSKLIYLDTPFEKCAERILGDLTRPKALGGISELKSLYLARLSNYQKAHFSLDLDQQNSIETITELIKII